MKASAFSYARATSVADALQLLGAHGDKAKLLVRRPEPDAGAEPAPARRHRWSISAGSRSCAALPSAGDGLADRRADPPCRDLPARADIAAARAAARAGHRPRRPSRDPQPRHASAAASPMPIPAAELPACTLALGATHRRPGPGRRAARSRRTTSSPACYETALAADEMLTAIEIDPAAPEDACAVLPNWPAAAATTPWSGWPRRRCRSAAPRELRLAFSRSATAPVLAPKRCRPLLGAEVTPAAIAARLRGACRGPRAARRPAGPRRDAAASRPRAAAPGRGALLRPPRSSAGAARDRPDPALGSTVNGERVEARCAPRTQSGRFPARARCAHRHPSRLRARRMRRLHRAARRRHRARLPGARGAGRGLRGRDDRGAVRQRRDRRPAGRVPRPQRAAMRVLHAGNADGGAGPAAARAGRRTADAIREHLSGNYCRCTGYHAIVDAVEATARAPRRRRHDRRRPDVLSALDRPNSYIGAPCRGRTSTA